MKLVFMGTPDFGLPILDAIKAAGHEILMVVTQPDAPVGRKQILTPPPVKKWAVSYGIPVYQPVRIRDKESVERLKDIKADIFVVAAFGQILPPEILFMPDYGSINVHASLLPKYRGASPIQWSILNGDDKTGVTIMQMDVGLDDGDILLQKEIGINPNDTGESLFDRLSELGGEAVTEAMLLLEQGRIKRIKQDEDKATKVGKIHKSMGEICFTDSAAEIERRIRGLYPWPGTFASLNGKRMKVLSAAVLDGTDLTRFDIDPGDTADAGCGEIVFVSKRELIVKCKEDFLSIKRVQPSGKKPMDISDYLRGHSVKNGERFDDEQTR